MTIYRNTELPFIDYATGTITEVVEVGEHSALVILDYSMITVIAISHAPLVGDYVRENELIEHECY